MNKIPCSIIQDLLVLYEDNVCSQDSRKLIEDHIATCDECRRIYEGIQKPLPDITLDNEKSLEEKQDKMFIQSMQKFTRKLTVKHMIIVSILIAALIIVDYTYQTYFKTYINAVPASDIQVTELYQLNNGDIYCTLKAPQPFDNVQAGNIIVPEENLWKNYDDGWHEVRFHYPKALTDTSELVFYQDTISFVFPMEESGNAPMGHQEPYHYTAASVKYVGKSPKDILTIWEKGQNIPQAPMEIEKKALHAYADSGDIEKVLEECHNLGLKFEDLGINDEILETVYDHYTIGGGYISEDSCPYHIYE